MEVELFSGVGSHSCAGSLIAPNVVLTVAHCVDYSAIRVVDTGRFSWKDDSNVEVFHIEKIYKHPDFFRDFFLNDVALLKLSGEASANPAPLHLGENIVKVGDKITAIGWGLISYGGYPSPDLRAVDVEVISKLECQRYYGNFVMDTMMCAYEYGRDACQGECKNVA